MNIKGLAQHLNLSIGTVSRALNGKRYVDETTRKRVLEAAAALGYSPNQSGRSLRQGTTGMIAFVLPTNPGMSVAETIFMPVIDGLRMFLGERDLDLMVLLCGPKESAHDHLCRVAGRRLADGFIIADTQRVDPRIDFLLQRSMPFVAFGRSSSGGSYPWIDLDFEGVAHAAVDRLVALGHRRIALGTMETDLNFGYVFADAFRAALGRHGIEAEPDWIVRAANTDSGGYQLAQRLLALPNRPTAALLGNETMAIGLYEALAEAGLAPGEDLSVIAFGPVPSTHFLSPRVTCFQTELRALGIRLGEALLRTMPLYAGTDPAAMLQEVWPMKMVVGDSDRPWPAQGALS